MHSRHLHIPTEILRTVIVIADTGSLSKAAERLGLSQPAVSSQVKRLQMIVGGAVFERTPLGTTTTHLGKLVIQQAKKMLEANDQILMLGGADSKPEHVKIGLATMFTSQFYEKTDAEMLSRMAVQIDRSVLMAKAMLDGYLDLACIYEMPEFASEIDQYVVDQFEEPLVWVRSKNFVLSPGAPLPVITWAGDNWMLRTLERRGIHYRIVTNTPDYHARFTAIQAGTGLGAMPLSRVPPSMVITRDYYVPELPKIRALLCMREHARSRRAEAVQKHISQLFFAGPTDTAAKPPLMDAV